MDRVVAILNEKGVKCSTMEIDTLIEAVVSSFPKSTKTKKTSIIDFSQDTVKEDMNPYVEAVNKALKSIGGENNE